MREKNISILVENFNSGLIYLIATVPKLKSRQGLIVPELSEFGEGGLMAPPDSGKLVNPQPGGGKQIMPTLLLLAHLDF